MNKTNNWITFPDGFSCNLNQIRSITKVEQNHEYCVITLRFNGCDKNYQWEFPYNNYSDSKEELIQKVEILREKLVKMANLDQDPLRAQTLINLKKKEDDDKDK